MKTSRVVMSKGDVMMIPYEYVVCGALMAGYAMDSLD